MYFNLLTTTVNQQRPHLICSLKWSLLTFFSHCYWYHAQLVEKVIPANTITLWGPCHNVVHNVVYNFIMYGFFNIVTTLWHKMKSLIIGLGFLVILPFPRIFNQLITNVHFPVCTFSWQWEKWQTNNISELEPSQYVTLWD